MFRSMVWFLYLLCIININGELTAGIYNCIRRNKCTIFTTFLIPALHFPIGESETIWRRRGRTGNYGSLVQITSCI